MDKILNETVEKFLWDMENNSKTELITAESELKKVVEKFGINFEDTRDFGFFKNVYAVTDKANKNGAILPKEVVVANLKSLRGKPININHERTQVRGFYLGGELENDIIYSYGVLFKSCFKEDWEKAEKYFQNGQLNTSFEIWCPKESKTFNNDGTYALNQITCAGGAILWPDTPPAFDEAVVVDFAKKLDIEAEELICAAKEDLIFAKEVKEKARMDTYNTNGVVDRIHSLECPKCGKDWGLRVDKIDFKNEVAQAVCTDCDAVYEIDLRPQMKEINYALKQKEKVIKEEPNKEEAKMEELQKKIAELETKLEAAQAKIKELEEAKAKEAGEAKKKLEEVEAAKKAVEEDLSKANETLKEIDEKAKAAKVKARREEIGDFAKDISDEDMLNDDKFALAKTKKENEELREKAKKAGIIDEDTDPEKSKEKKDFFKVSDDAYFKLMDQKRKNETK